VVIYGDADKSWGGEGYDVWLLSWLGHKGPVRLLSGGIQAWKERNLPMVKGAEKPYSKKAGYKINVNPRLTISTEELERQKGSLVLIDVRSTFEWFKGRIPGAVHIPWDDFHTGKDRHPLPPAELKKLLVRHGVDTSRPVVYYCLGGVRSAYAWLAHHLAGLPEARNYEGGWAAWQKRDSR
jgi:thiosulfate/3-mercaptopyruvate sulfurtransferase